jgi:hypothetical membrane protein
MKKSETPREHLLREYPLFGITGCALIVVAVAIAGMTYRGSQGEHFSLLNHYVSELGRQGVSQGAWIFNAAMIASGVMFIPFVIGLGIRLGSRWGYAGMIAGICTGALCAGVGIFPMNRLAGHIFSAVWFFRLGLLTVSLFGIAILLQKKGKERIPKSAAVISLLAALAYGAFIVLGRLDEAPGMTTLNPDIFTRRPDFWLMPFLEWTVFFATVLWFLGMGVASLGKKKK